MADVTFAEPQQTNYQQEENKMRPVLSDNDIVALCEATIRGSGGVASEDDMVIVIKWAQDLALQAAILESVLNGTVGVFVDENHEVMVTLLEDSRSSQL